MSETLHVSALGKTWLLDLDGTIVKHNGYKLDGHDTLLPGAKEFLAGLPAQDLVVFVTSRPQELAAQTEAFLAAHALHYHAIVYGAPYGERILVNDRKPSGLATAIAVNPERDRFMDVRFQIDPAL